MANFHILFIFFIILQMNCIIWGKYGGSIGELELFYIKECDPPIEDIIDLKVEIKTLDNGNKALDAEFTVPYDINEDEDIELYFNADQWKNGFWQKNIFLTNGGFFETVQRFIPLAWEHFREVVEPKINDQSIIKAGTYKVTNFTEVAKHLEVDLVMYGRYRATISLFKDDVELVCRVCQLDLIEEN